MSQLVRAERDNTNQRGWRFCELPSGTFVWYQVAFKNYRKAVGDDVVPTRAALQQFVIHERDRGIRPVTFNTYVAAMNAICAWLDQEGNIGEVVKLKKLRVEKRVLELLNDTQLKALIGFRPETYRQARTHTAVLLVLDTGLRVSEALNLKKSDVDADNLILKVFGKGGSACISESTVCGQC